MNKNIKILTRWIIVILILFCTTSAQARRIRLPSLHTIEGTPDKVLPFLIQHILQRVEEEDITFFQIIGRPGGGKSTFTSELIAELEHRFPQDTRVLRLSVDHYLLPSDQRPTTEENPTLLIDLSHQREFTTPIGWDFSQISEGEIEIKTPIGNFTHQFTHPGENYIVPILISNMPSISIQYEGEGKYLWEMPVFLAKISWQVYSDILKILNGEPVLKPLYSKEERGYLRLSPSEKPVLDYSKQINGWIYSSEKSEELGKEIYVNSETGELRELLMPGDDKTILIAEGVWLGLTPEINRRCDGILALATIKELIAHWLKGRVILADISKGDETVPQRIEKQNVGWVILQDPFIEPAIDNVRRMEDWKTEAKGFIVYITNPEGEQSERGKALSTFAVTGEILDLEQRISKALERYYVDIDIKKDGEIFNPYNFLKNYILPILPMKTPLYKYIEAIIETTENRGDINEVLNSPLFEELTFYTKAILISNLLDIRKRIEVPVSVLEGALKYIPSDSKLFRCFEELIEGTRKGMDLNEILKASSNFDSLSSSEKEVLYNALPQIPFLLFEPPEISFKPQVLKHPIVSKKIGELLTGTKEIPIELLYMAKERGVEDWLVNYILTTYEEEEEISAIADRVKETFIASCNILYFWEKLQEYAGPFHNSSIAVLGCGDLYPWLFLKFSAQAQRLDGVEREEEFQSVATNYIQQVFSPEEQEDVHWIKGNMISLGEISEIKGQKYDLIIIRPPFYTTDLLKTLTQARDFLTDEGKIVLFMRERDFVIKGATAEAIEKGVREFGFMEFDAYPLTKMSTIRSERCVVLDKEELNKMIEFLSIHKEDF